MLATSTRQKDGVF